MLKVSSALLQLAVHSVMHLRAFVGVALLAEFSEIYISEQLYEGNRVVDQ